MIVSFVSAYDCTCGATLKGIKVAGVRVNLHSLRTDSRGLTMIQSCECGENAPMPTDLTWQLQPEDAAKVEAAREKIRARRKKAS